MTRNVEFSESGEAIGNWKARLEESAQPHYKTTVELEALLRSAFLVTQEKVHVITESLKASGKTETDFDGDTWTGTIIYGGSLWRVPSPGPPNDPVRYAIYEIARGGDHDFFAGLETFGTQIEEILHGGFPG